jgi:UTP--glucose-1-phosphate uridylyltransferase
MLPLLNRPVMEWLVYECIEAGINQIIIVTNDNGMSQYSTYFKNDLSSSNGEFLEWQNNSPHYYASVERLQSYADKITILAQDKSLPYGSASPIVTARPYLENVDVFVVLLSDDVIIGHHNDTLALINSFSAEPTHGAVLAAQQMDESELHNYGVDTLFLRK